jgi:hypothetical protein
MKPTKMLEEAWAALQQTDDVKLGDIMMDSCAKQFEYIMDTAWRIRKKFLMFRYRRDNRDLTITNLFPLMAGYAFINSWEKWREYYAKRNKISHEYNMKRHVFFSLVVNLSFAIRDKK